jgi:hypothetical protein
MEAQQKQHGMSESETPLSMSEGESKIRVEKPKTKKIIKSSNTSLNSSTEKEDKKSKKKGQKLYCICRTPYDKSK